MNPELSTSKSAKEHQDGIVYNEYGLRIERRGDYLVIQVKEGEERLQKIVHWNDPRSYRGQLELKDAVLNYWLNETSDTWQLMYGFRTEVQGEFSKLWVYKNISVTRDGAVSVEEGRAPSGEREFPRHVFLFGAGITLFATLCYFIRMMLVSDAFP